MVLFGTDAGFNNFDDNTAWLCERWWNGQWRSCLEAPFWTGFKVTKHPLLWTLLHNWPDWICQKVKISTSASRGKPEYYHVKHADSNGIARSVRAIPCAGIIQSIRGQYRSPQETCQLFNWKKAKIGALCKITCNAFKVLLQSDRKREKQKKWWESSNCFCLRKIRSRGKRL